MEYSLKKLTNGIETLNNSLNQLCASFNCEWYDEVRDSYETYVLQCQSSTQGIESLIGALVKNCSELDPIEPDKIYQDAESVCVEVNSFS